MLRGPDRWLFTAVSDFGRSCKVKLAGGGGPEAAIRGPLENLLKAVGEHHAMPEVSWHDEVAVPELGVRPDYAIRAKGVVTGYVEIKRPGLAVDPKGFTGRNRKQWKRLSDLPNLLYTNGTEWRLFRDGKPFGEPARLVGTLTGSGERLAPADAAAFDALLKRFLFWTPPPIGTVFRLVQHVAPLCRLLRAAVLEQLAAEARSTAPDDDASARPFTGLEGDWRRLLFPSVDADADADAFADGYAQTVTFALLLARTENIPLAGSDLHEIGRRLNRDHALMGTALQLLTGHVNERFEVTLDLLVQTVDCVDWPAIHNGNRDAYLHLYERFLTLYDPALRQRSGSYYTPREVVEEMVRLTEDVLRTRLGKEHGYADDDVRIVDPAMGTGTFLHAIIERVARYAAERSGGGMRRDAVTRLARRLYGFEVQINPFAVAELRASDLIREQQAPLPDGGLSFYLTDTLETPFVDEQEPLFAYGALSASRIRANRVKGEIPIMVVIGNPPYDDKAEGRGGWVEKPSEGRRTPLLAAFRHPGNGRHEHMLKNMYVYFWRWATWKVFDAHTEDRQGVVCFITPSGFATGPGGRGMRDYLRRTCDEGWVVDLSPEGHRADVATRVFPGVAQPLGIFIFLRRGGTGPRPPARVHYRSVAGRRADKLRQLAEVRLDDDGWRNTHDGGERPFTPATQSGWDDFPALNDLFPWGSPGVKANRAWVSAPARQTLEWRWARLVRESDPAAKKELFKETPDRPLDRTVPPLPGRPDPRCSIRRETSPDPSLTCVALRSFDRQWMIDDNRVLDRARPDLWAALREGQLFLNQQSSHAIESGPAVVATALIPDTHHFNGRGGKVLPRLHPDGSGNVPRGLLAHLARVLGVERVTSLDLAAYTVAVAGHAAFTEQFAEDLLTPGVRVPITRDPSVWRRAVGVGTEVIWASTYGERCVDPAEGRPAGRVEFDYGDPRQVRYLADIGTAVPDHRLRPPDPETSTLHLGEGAFAPVPGGVFDFDVGGMNVLRQWFGYRKASPNSKKTSPLDDIHVEEWPEAWTRELIQLLSVLRRLVDVAPTQRDLLADVLAGPVVTAGDLEAAGILPVPAEARRARHGTDTGLFAIDDAET